MFIGMEGNFLIMKQLYWLFGCMGIVYLYYKVNQIFMLKSLEIYVQDGYEILLGFYFVRMQYLYMIFRFGIFVIIKLLLNLKKFFIYF